MRCSRMPELVKQAVWINWNVLEVAPTGFTMSNVAGQMKLLKCINKEYQMMLYRIDQRKKGKWCT